MPDTPVDKTLQEGLKEQAKLIAVAVHNTLKEYHSKHLSDKEIKDVIDAIYTALYSVNYYKESSEAAEFLRFHAKQIQEIKGEVGLLEGFGG